jgi:hypothetical protein
MMSNKNKHFIQKIMYSYNAPMVGEFVMPNSYVTPGQSMSVGFGSLAPSPPMQNLGQSGSVGLGSLAPRPPMQFVQSPDVGMGSLALPSRNAFGHPAEIMAVTSEAYGLAPASAMLAPNAYVDDQWAEAAMFRNAYTFGALPNQLATGMDVEVAVQSVSPNEWQGLKPWMNMGMQNWTVEKTAAKARDIAPSRGVGSSCTASAQARQRLAQLNAKPSVDRSAANKARVSRKVAALKKKNGVTPGLKALLQNTASCAR